MAERGKGFLALGGLLAAFLGFRSLLRKPAVEGFKATVVLQIIDPSTGKPVPKGSPALVIEGAGYLARFSITNKSTRLGVAVGAELGIRITGRAGTQTISFVAPFSALFQANQAIPWESTFTIPLGTGGLTGDVTVVVTSPTGATLATATEPLAIESAAVVYSATLTPITVL